MDGKFHKGYSYADLPIATAARLSATFPLVSSASRVPAQFAPYAYHFVDGGYYDNDGTAWPSSFLALRLRNLPPPGFGRTPASNPVQFHLQHPRQVVALPAPPLAILLIEIRNGDDLNPLSNVDDYNFQTHPENKHAGRRSHSSLHLQERFGKPAMKASPGGTAWAFACSRLPTSTDSSCTMWFSTTIRRPPNPENKNQTDEIQPLNWHLTAGERKQITDKASDRYTDAAINNAKDWVSYLETGNRNGLRPPVATDGEEACRIAWVRESRKTSSPKLLGYCRRRICRQLMIGT